MKEHSIARMAMRSSSIEWHQKKAMLGKVKRTGMGCDGMELKCHSPSSPQGLDTERRSPSMHPLLTSESSAPHM